MLFVFFILVFGLNNHHLGYSEYYNMDFFNYFSLYNDNNGSLSQRDYEIGFKFLILICNSCNLSFMQFRILISCLGYLLIFSTIEKYSSYPNLVLLLYMIYPFINDIIQIRNFFAYSIVLFSIRYLIENKKNNIYKFLLCIFLASAFHISSVFYFTLVFVKLFNNRQIIKNARIFVPLLVLLSYTPIIPLLVKLIFKSDKIYKYFLRRTTWGLLIVFGLLFLIYFIQLQMNNTCQKYILDVNNSKKIKSDIIIIKRNYYEILLKMNSLLLFTAPLLVYNFNYIRLYRNILVLNYIIYIDAIMYNKSKNKYYDYLILIIVQMLILFMLFYGLHYDEQIIPVLSDNYLSYFFLKNNNMLYIK